MMELYDGASSGFIESNLDVRLYDKLMVPLFNISAVLGDNSGKIGSKTVSFLLAQLQYLPEINKAVINLPPIEDLNNLSYYDTEFPGVGYQALQVLEAKGSLVNTYDFSEISSPLLLKSIKVIPEYGEIMLAVKQSFISLLGVFVTMVTANQDTGVNTITITELSALSRNIQYMSIYIEDNYEDSWDKYELVEMLRDLYRAIRTIIMSRELFTETYGSKFNTIYRGVV